MREERKLFCSVVLSACRLLLDTFLRGFSEVCGSVFKISDSDDLLFCTLDVCRINFSIFLELLIVFGFVLYEPFVVGYFFF